MKENTRPGLAVAAEVLGYVIGGLCIVGSLVSEDESIGIEMLFLVGGGVVATSVLVRKGLNWARITFTALIGFLTLSWLFALGEESSDEDEDFFGLLVSSATCAIVFSWTPKVNHWFREMAKQRELVVTTERGGMRICKACGAFASCSSRYCAKCGVSLDEERQ